jgi:hypothetical protein
VPWGPLGMRIRSDLTPTFLSAVCKLVSSVKGMYSSLSPWRSVSKLVGDQKDADRFVEGSADVFAAWSS